jgi:hypothetical protein
MGHDVRVLAKSCVWRLENVYWVPISQDDSAGSSPALLGGPGMHPTVRFKFGPRCLRAEQQGSLAR